MTPLLVAALAFPAAAAPAPAPAPAPGRPHAYGLLILAYGAGPEWRKELGSLRSQLRGMAVESVEGAADTVAVQKAVERLGRQRVDKIVAVPLETVAESALMDKTRFLFGVRETAAEDVPDAESERLAGGRPTSLKPVSSDRRAKRVKSPVPLVLAPTLDQSPLLAAMLAERAQRQTREPGKTGLVLVGRAPRSDKALKTWQTAADAIAEQVRAKGGFARAAALGVRDGVRSEQREHDHQRLKARLRELMTEGPVVAVPLSPDPAIVERLLRSAVGGVGYHWDGKGVLGDKRLLDWIKTTAETSSKLPDGRRYTDTATRGNQ